MAKSNKRINVLLRNKETGASYITNRNKKGEKISVKKYDPVLRQHVLMKETKA
jgi:large subunit ribosomal protein L33